LDIPVRESNSLLTYTFGAAIPDLSKKQIFLKNLSRGGLARWGLARKFVRFCSSSGG
jgi:hypothetical protein